MAVTIKTSAGDLAGVMVTATGTGYPSNTSAPALAVVQVGADGAPVPAGSTSSPSFVASPSAVPLGYQQILAATLASSTALTVPGGATYAVIQVEGGAIRWRDDGVAPTATVGMRLLTDGELFYDGSLSAFRAILATGTPILNIAYYR